MEIQPRGKRTCSAIIVFMAILWTACDVGSESFADLDAPQSPEAVMFPTESGGELADVANDFPEEDDHAEGSASASSSMGGEDLDEPADPMNSESVFVDSESEDVDPGDDEGVAVPVPAEIPEYHGSDPTQWSLYGTAKLPSYGSGCRFVTDTVYEVPSDGFIDDVWTLELDNNGDATLALDVDHEGETILSATVSFERALSMRSFRRGVGQASYGLPGESIWTGEVVDGTLCFENPLASGVDLFAEFSLIIAVAGEYHATGGNVLIPGGGIDLSMTPTIDANVGVDLQ